MEIEKDFIVVTVASVPNEDYSIDDVPAGKLGTVLQVKDKQILVKFPFYGERWVKRNFLHIVAPVLKHGLAERKS